MRFLSMSLHIRALRLPFIAASILPFIAGSLIAKENFQYLPFLLGLLAVASTHLGANLINDYADSKSGVDWKDRKFYGLFGGSKLIQEGILSEQSYLMMAIFYFLLALASIISLSILFKSTAIYGYFLVIGLLAFCYSHKPLQLSYHRMGEFIIFLLFGPALVMGGYYIQTQNFPTPEGFLLSLPFGFFTMAILFANEIPDYDTDRATGKMNWVSIVGKEKAYRIYEVIMVCGFVSIAGNIYLGYLHFVSILSFILIFMVFKATRIMKNDFADKEKLLASSMLTIQIQTLVSIVLILGKIF